MENTNPGVLLSDIDLLVLRRKAHGLFVPVYWPGPSWTSILIPTAFPPEGVRVGDHVLFLENFLVDAEAFWAENADGRLRSGMWYETTADGKERLFEATALRSDGERLLLIQAFEPKEEDRQTLIQTGRDRDLSHQEELNLRRQTEAALREAKELAEEANRSKSQFLSNVSHELRTPLNAIIGFTEILSDQVFGALNEQQSRYIGNVLTSSQHLVSMINDLLDLAKVEAGKVEIDPIDLDLDVLVYEAVSACEGLVTDKPVELVADIPEVVRPICSDYDRLSQILLNLISNAVKFTKEGSVKVCVVTGEGDRPERIDVIDTGIGIAPDDLELIFDAFSQVETDETRGFEGTGLGLAISKSLCALLGFDLRVTSTQGEGSTFSIVLNP